MREAILAIRQQGWAWVDGELDESICGLAVPVRDRRGATIAALNVSLPSGEFTREQAMERFLGELRVAASRLRASDRLHIAEAPVWDAGVLCRASSSGRGHSTGQGPPRRYPATGTDVELPSVEWLQATYSGDRRLEWPPVKVPVRRQK